QFDRWATPSPKQCIAAFHPGAGFSDGHPTAMRQRLPRRRETPWTRPDAALDGWGGVDVLPFDTGRPTPYIGPPVRRQEVLQPARIWLSPAGRTLVDFG